MGATRHRKQSEFMVSGNKVLIQSSDKAWARKKKATSVSNSREGDLVVIYHQTAVYTQDANGIQTLNSGGWETTTTKARINDFLINATLYQKDYEWYICDSHGIDHDFYDGMKINLDGVILLDLAT